MNTAANVELGSEALEEEEVDVYLVSTSFVKQYYWILNERTDLLHQFYGPDSSVVVSESLGGDSHPYVVAATTPEDLCQLLQHLFKQVVVTLTELLPQRTVCGSVMVMVTGKMAQEMWTEERCFTQVFLLARQATGFYIRTDTLQVHNPTETIQMLKGMSGTASVAEATKPFVDADEGDGLTGEGIPEVEMVAGIEVSVYEVQEEHGDHVGDSLNLPDVSAGEDVFEITPPMPVSQLVQAEAISEADSMAAIQTPRSPDATQTNTGTSEGGNPWSGEKKSFLEVVLSGAKRGNPKPAPEQNNPKVTAINSVAAEHKPLGDVPEAPAHRFETSKALNGINEAEGRPQRGRASRQPHANGNRAGAEDGAEANSSARGRGRGGTARGNHENTVLAQLSMLAGRNTPGRNGGRGGRLPRNPSSEAPGERASSGSNPDRNEDRSTRTIFVGQLPMGSDVKTIHSAFSTFGGILGGPEGITVRTGPKNAFAFVVFEESSSARKALEGNVKIHGEELAIKPYAPRERPVMKERTDVRGRRGGYGGRGNGRSAHANGGFESGNSGRNESAVRRDRGAAGHRDGGDASIP